MRLDKSSLIIVLCFAWLIRISYFVRMRTSTDYSSVDTYALFQIVIVLFLFVLTLSEGHSRNWDRLKLSYVAYVGILLSWTSVSPLLSLFRSLEVLTFINVTSYFCEKIEFPKRRKLIHYMAITCYLGFLLRRNNYTLETLHHNGFGVMFMSLLIFEILLWNARLDKRLIRILIYTTIFLFSSSLASVLGLLIFLILYNIKKVRLSHIFILFVASFLFPVLIELFLVNKDADELAEGNGRLYLWEQLFNLILQKPYTGHGYAMLGRVNEGMYATNSHNSVIGILGGIGLLAGIPLVIRMIFVCIKDVFFRNNRLAVYLLVPVFINSMSKAFIGEQIYPETIIFFMLASSLYTWDNSILLSTNANTVIEDNYNTLK